MIHGQWVTLTGMLISTNVLGGSEINLSWKALFQILNHPWFSRIWVIQELVLSSNPLV